MIARNARSGVPRPHAETNPLLLLLSAMAMAASDNAPAGKCSNGLYL